MPPKPADALPSCCQTCFRFLVHGAPRNASFEGKGVDQRRGVRGSFGHPDPKRPSLVFYVSSASVGHTYPFKTPIRQCTCHAVRDWCDVGHFQRKGMLSDWPFLPCSCRDFPAKNPQKHLLDGSGCARRWLWAERGVFPADRASRDRRGKTRPLVHLVHAVLSNITPHFSRISYFMRRLAFAARS